MVRHARTRETQQRRVVYEAIKGTHNHPTADWIFEHVRDEMPKISLGTVYRNLSVLKNEGLVREIYGSDRRARYEARTTPHAHFVCSGCGEIRDIGGLPEVELDGLDNLAGCEIEEQRLEFMGTCPACLRRRRDRSSAYEA
jgi:Fe2+ or Zn2+ uptake regulation protein